MMDGNYTIGQLAKEADVATSTVRYYERVGLLKPSGRTPHAYRYYGKEALERLRFIRAAQASGFTLDDVSSLVSLADGTTPPCAEVQELVEQRLGDVEGRLKALKQVRGVLRSSLESCREGEAAGECRVINSLKQKALPGESGRSPGKSRQGRRKKSQF